MTQVVTALYDSYDSALSAVNALEDAGIPHSDISIVSNNADDRYRRDDRTKTAEDAGKGAGIGAANLARPVTARAEPDAGRRRAAGVVLSRECRRRGSWSRGGIPGRRSPDALLLQYRAGDLAVDSR